MLVVLFYDPSAYSLVCAAAMSLICISSEEDEQELSGDQEIKGALLIYYLITLKCDQYIYFT